MKFVCLLVLGVGIAMMIGAVSELGEISLYLNILWLVGSVAIMFVGTLGFCKLVEEY